MYAECPIWTKLRTPKLKPAIEKSWVLFLNFGSPQEDLPADWDLAVHGKKPFPIKGLDQ
jgi:hypothetical protein